MRKSEKDRNRGEGGKKTAGRRGGREGEFAKRYGTVVILKTIIRASGGTQVSQGRTVTAISIASQ